MKPVREKILKETRDQERKKMSDSVRRQLREETDDSVSSTRGGIYEEVNAIKERADDPDTN